MITITKFGKIFFIVLAVFLVIFGAYIAFVIWFENSGMSGMFPVDNEADVYIVYMGERIPVTEEDAVLIKDDIVHTKRSYGGKCPTEFDIAIEIGNYRYLPALDGCNTLRLYTTGGEYIKEGDNYCYNWIKKYINDNK